ncbi:GNAT family N-acetyltransferase [Nocardia sp. NPDC004573]
MPRFRAAPGRRTTRRSPRSAISAGATRTWANVLDTLLAVRPRGSFDVRAAERVGDTVVATVDGVVVGFVMVDRDEVDQVYVAAAHRGTGSAALLLAAAEERARAEGHARAWFAVVAGNTRARRFYANRGRVDEGAFVHAAPGPTGPVAVPAHRYTELL